LLIEHGADINALDGEYGTALVTASWYGYESIARLLLENGADVNVKGGRHDFALNPMARPILLGYSSRTVPMSLWPSTFMGPGTSRRQKVGWFWPSGVHNCSRLHFVDGQHREWKAYRYSR
jgi:hypothetical protein